MPLGYYRQLYSGIKVLIKEVQDISEIIKCLPFEIEIQRKGRDNGRASHLISFIQTQLNNPFFKFLIAYDEESEEDIIGYTIAIINPIPGYKELCLLRIYAKNKKVREEFERIGEEIMAENKLKRVSMTVQERYIKVFKRYGFTPVSVNMIRESKRVKNRRIKNGISSSASINGGNEPL